MDAWLIKLTIQGILLAAILAIIWAFKREFGLRKPHENKSHLSLIIGMLFGMEGWLYFGGGLAAFLVGLHLTIVVVDTFWPQYNNVAWIRIAGSFGSLVVYLLALSRFRKVSSEGTARACDGTTD
jgi:hypothetical protein